MASLFQGSPQTATSYATSTTESPKWMQDAIYNQIQWATNLAQTPYQEYKLDTVAPLSDMQKQAYANVGKNQDAWKTNMDSAASGMSGFATKGTAEDLKTAQNQYLRQGLVDKNLDAGQGYFGQAGKQDIMGAANPYLTQASNTTAEALSDKALNAANPYLLAASQSSAANIGQYMNPYQQNAMDVIAKQGARNLGENLLPQVSDAFIKAGQFGGSRMGEFGSRALRDTQEAILDKQSQMANQGYAQALSTSSGDLARQAQLAGTVGSISGADLSRVLQGGAQYGNLGQTAGNLTGQQQQNLANLGQLQTTAGQAQQNFGLTAAQAAQQAQAQDYSRQMQALMNTGTLTQQQNALRTSDVAALEAAGLAQRNVAQQYLTAAQQEFQNQQLYPQQQLDWLNSQIKGIASNVPKMETINKGSTGDTYSAGPLAQLGSAVAAYKGLTSI